MACFVVVNTRLVVVVAVVRLVVGAIPSASELVAVTSRLGAEVVGVLTPEKNLVVVAVVVVDLDVVGVVDRDVLGVGVGVVVGVAEDLVVVGVAEDKLVDWDRLVEEGELLDSLSESDSDSVSKVAEGTDVVDDVADDVLSPFWRGSVSAAGRAESSKSASVKASSSGTAPKSEACSGSSSGCELALSRSSVGSVAVSSLADQPWFSSTATSDSRPTASITSD